MSKPGRRITEAEVPLPRNRMIPLLVALLLLLAARYWSQRNAPAPDQAPPQGETAAKPDAAPTATPSDSETPTVAKHPAPKPKSGPTATVSSTRDASSPLVIRDLALRDQDDRVIYRGDIDLRPTLERIAAGKKLRFPNDGSVFQNREGRLPRQPSGSYREWVVPTPGEDGPGPQRIVTESGFGKEQGAAAWYTADHYRTFRKLLVGGVNELMSKNRRNDE